MSSNPLVSAVMIFLNAERFIEEAIESVFAQTYDNWELLLVNDGSTDGSAQIARRYAERRPDKVRYLEHPENQNRGMSASRNLGIEYAKGEYLAFLDADDVWLPHALERGVAIFGSHPKAAMIYGPAQYWYSWTGDPKDFWRDTSDFVEEYVARPNALVEPLALLAILLRGEGGVPCPCSVLARRKVVENVGGFDEEFRGQYEDQVFYAKMGLQAPVFVTDECWCKYRRHPGSSWHIAQQTSHTHFARLFFLDWLARYMSEQAVTDAGSWELLRREQRLVRIRLHLREREWRQTMGEMVALLRHHPREFIKRLFSKVRHLAIRPRTGP